MTSHAGIFQQAKNGPVSGYRSCRCLIHVRGCFCSTESVSSVKKGFLILSRGYNVIINLVVLFIPGIQRIID